MSEENNSQTEPALSSDNVVLSAENITSSAPSEAHRSEIRKIFLGPNGLRAGWRLAIFVLIISVLASALRFAFKLLHLPTIEGQLTPLGTILSAGTGFAMTVIAAWIMSRIEGRAFGRYGLPGSQAFRKDLWVGLLWGLLTMSSTLLTIVALHAGKISGAQIHGKALLVAAIYWAFAFLVVGFNEEFGFRGYIQYTLTTGMGFWPSAILISGLFGLAHARNSGENVFGEMSVVLFGLLFCLFLLRRGNLWWAVGFHMGYDWTETFFWGAPDSGILPSRNFLSSTFSGPNWLTGGSVGPEASIVTPICLLIVAILFSLVYRENRYRTGVAQSIQRQLV